MESIELKSTQSRFYDSNNDLSKSTSAINDISSIQIDDPNTNQSVLTTEGGDWMEKMNTHQSSADLERYLTKLSKISNCALISHKIDYLIKKSREAIKIEYKDEVPTLVYTTRKEGLMTLASVQSLTRLISKKFPDVNYQLKIYLEEVLMYDSILEITSNKEVFINFTNCLTQLIKEVGNSAETFLLESRLSNYITKSVHFFTVNNEPTIADIQKTLVTQSNKQQESLNTQKQNVIIYLLKK